MNENNENSTEVNDNPPENPSQLIQNNANVFESIENTSQQEVNQNDEDKANEAEKNQNDVICSDCGKKFESKIRLNNHKEDAHSGTQYCTLCPLEFSLKSCLRRHKKEIHRKHEEVALCMYCGKTLSRNDKLHNHEETCNEEIVRKKRTIEKKFDCEYCERKFSSKKASNLHKKIKHVVLMNTGYMIVTEEPTLEVNEFICKVCPIPIKFATKSNMKKHMIKRHNGRNDQIKFGANFINLGDDEIEQQASKVAKKRNSLAKHVEKFSKMENI